MKCALICCQCANPSSVPYKSVFSGLFSSSEATLVALQSPWRHRGERWGLTHWWDIWLCFRGYLNAFISFLCSWDGNEEMRPEEGAFARGVQVTLWAWLPWTCDNRGKRDFRAWAEGFLVSSGNKAQGQDETAKMEFRGEALGAPRLFMKLATWFLAAFS